MTEDINRSPQAVPQEATTFLSNRGKMLIGLIVLIAGLSYFSLMAFDGATVYYYTVDELHALGPTADGQVVRVSGKLNPTSFHREESSTLAKFTLTDGVSTLQATHDGVLPDLFSTSIPKLFLKAAFYQMVFSTAKT